MRRLAGVPEVHKFLVDGRKKVSYGDILEVSAGPHRKEKLDYFVEGIFFSLDILDFFDFQGFLIELHELNVGLLVQLLIPLS